MARCGVASRRACELLISEGRVKVNGRVVTQPGTKIDPAADRVEVDGRVLRPPRTFVYYIINKPRGYVTTVRDPQGRPTVMDIVAHVKERVYPVGRLDADTEGLLVLTNDGALANKLMHPRYQVGKRYRATVRGHIGDDALRRLAVGVPLEDGMTAPAKVRLISREQRRSIIELTLFEGRNRQVRRMCAYVGHPVIALLRTSMGPLQLSGLAPGSYRPLTADEVRRLRRAVSRPRK